MIALAARINQEHLRTLSRHFIYPLANGFSAMISRKRPHSQAVN